MTEGSRAGPIVPGLATAPGGAGEAGRTGTGKPGPARAAAAAEESEDYESWFGVPVYPGAKLDDDHD